MLGLILAALATATAAFAYWSTRGTGTASASTGTLDAATAVNASSPALATVNVSWTPPTSPGAGGTLAYYVQRTTGTTTAAACGTSAGTTITASSCTDSSVPGGRYTYRVMTVFTSWTAMSAASGSVTVNTVPKPTVTLTAPANGSIAKVRTPTFSGTASENATVTITLTGGITYTTSVTGTTSPYSFSFTPTSALADGTYAATASQTNGTGTGTSSTNTFLLDATAPAPTVSTVGSNNFTKTTTPTISGTAGRQAADSSHSADVGTVSVTLYPGTATSGNSVFKASSVTVNSSTGAWSVTPTLTANAQYTAVVQQTDDAGNTGTSTRTFVVDTAPPTVSKPTVNGRS